MVEISMHPSNMNEGSIPGYLFGDRERDLEAVSAVWENILRGFIHSYDGWYTCMVAEVEDTKEVVGYCAWEWFEYNELGKRVIEKDTPAGLRRIWDELGNLHTLSTLGASPNLRAIH